MIKRKDKMGPIWSWIGFELDYRLILPENGVIREADCLSGGSIWSWIGLLNRLEVRHNRSFKKLCKDELGLVGVGRSGGEWGVP